MPSEAPTPDLRVWWIPQIPGTSFQVSVASVAEGVKLMDVLAKYDAFQFAHNIKPDYCNAGGLQMKDAYGEWVDWCDDETGIDDPEEWLREHA
jgi:hypothetical protein